MSNMDKNIMDKDLQIILDCFSGLDGGITFIQLKILLKELEEKANANDQSAKELVKAVHVFANIITFASKL